MFLQHGMIQLNMDGSHGIFQGSKTRKLAIALQPHPAGYENILFGFMDMKNTHPQNNIL
jgi:hypothetical protein